ncbi:MAG: B12-binding domain-containing radical SAM protein [Proteobacteria bacterium]|nr:B12-binding domain-containing radical SAM protein [Pseudomonadota bacterium]
MNGAPLPKPMEVDLLLIFPPFQRLVVSMENIGIEYIAASARAHGFTCAMINAGLHGLSVNDMVEIIGRCRYRVLGISTIHWTLPAAVKIAKAARETHPDGHIVFGGIEAALDAERILLAHPFVDCVSLGEGERTVVSLLLALSEGRDWRDIEGIAYRRGDVICYTRTAKLIDPLDDLPFPARDDMAAVLDAGGAVSMSSSRGCTGRCAFCSVRAFYGLSRGDFWRGRSPLSVVTEMQEIREQYGARLFSFIDETVVGPGKKGGDRLREMAQRIRESDMSCEFFMTMRADQVEKTLFQDLKSAGLRKVEIGIESMAPSQLRRYGKIANTEDNRRALSLLEELGIAAEIFMVPFDPGVTRAEMEKNLDFYGERFKKCGGYDVSPLSMGNYLYPYPGTGTKAIYAQNGWLRGNHHASFRTKDPEMQKVGEVLIRLVGAVEPAFPMSYLGLGNLWINSAGLSEPVYGRINRMCGELGELLVAVARWTLSVTPRPLPIPMEDIAALIGDLRRFLAGFAQLRKELRGIVSASKNDGAKPQALKTGNPFARELYALGQQRKLQITDEMQDREPDEYDIITAILDLLTEGAAT